MAKIKVQVGDVVVETQDDWGTVQDDLLKKCMDYATEEARRVELHKTIVGKQGMVVENIPGE